MEDLEKQICERIRGGDKSALEYVFKTYYKILCAYASRILDDPDASEDIVQEIFFLLWQKREALQLTTSLKSYLFRAVHNRCLNQLKHRKTKDAFAQHILHTNDTASGNQAAPLDTKILESAIGQAIDRLPPERKKIFLMIRFEERKYKEVADILGISVKTVENQMGKAMQFLRQALKEYLPMLLLWITNFYK